MCSSEFNLQGTIMNYLPSKELLTAIRNDKYIVIDIDTSDIADSKIGYLLDNNQWYFINIYELAYKCKVWATENKYTILTEDMHPNGYFAYVLSNKESIENYGYLCEHKVIKDIPHNKTEPEAIFAACQWILDNRN